MRVDWKTASSRCPAGKADFEHRVSAHCCAYRAEYRHTPLFRYDVYTKAKVPQVGSWYTVRTDDELSRFEELCRQVERCVDARYRGEDFANPIRPRNYCDLSGLSDNSRAETPTSFHKVTRLGLDLPSPAPYFGPTSWGRLTFPATGVCCRCRVCEPLTAYSAGRVRMGTDRYGSLRINEGPQSVTRRLRDLAPRIFAWAPITPTPYLSVLIRILQWFSVGQLRGRQQR